MGKYIDSNGLSHLIGLFKPALLPSGGSAGQVLVKSSATDYDASWATSSGGSASTYYATCSTAAATAAKAITVAGWTPAAGDLLAVHFTTANTAATPTLSINGTSYGMYVGNIAANSTTNVLKWSAYTTLLLAYDGECFKHIASQSIGTANQPDGAGTWYGTCSTAAGTAAKTASATNFRLTPGAVVAITCTTANTVSGQITLNVSSTGAKVVYSGNAATSATNPLLWDVGDVLLFVYATYWRFLGRAKTRVSQTVTTGTEIATVDGTPIYAPSGGGSGKVDTESTNGTDTAIIDNAGGAIEFAATDGTNDVLMTIDTVGTTIETTDGTDTSSVTVKPTGVTIASSHVEVGGLLNLLNANIDRDGRAPSATVWSDSDIRFTDVDAEELAHLRVFETTSGTMAARLQVNNEPAGGGTAVSNYIQLSVSKNGAVNYSFGDAAAFRAALGFDTWKNVALSDFATAASGWSFVSGGCVIQRNEALGAVRCRLQLTPSANQTAGQKTVATVKAAYRPKTVHGSLSSLTSNAQAAQLYTSGGMAANILAISSGVNLYFNGVYFIGS